MKINIDGMDLDVVLDYNYIIIKPIVPDENFKNYSFRIKNDETIEYFINTVHCTVENIKCCIKQNHDFEGRA